jgi:Carboxypeptidase regulatory-like domain/TonB dependent receptor
MAYEKLALRAILMLICVASMVTGARAQYRAGVQGTILDSSGAGVQGATVTLTNKDNGRVLVYTSDAAGVYTFLSLPPGQFSIEVEKAGFKKQILDNVTVAAEQTQSVDVSLEIGEATTSVTVSGDSTPALDTETGQISGTLTTKEVQELPSLGRDPFQLLRLAPGVFGDGAHGSGGGSQDLPGSQGPGGTSTTSSIFQTENQVQINANGQRNTSNSFQVDGVSVNSLDWGGAATITPNEESVKEVRITSNSYDAEFGRTSGAQIEVVSQSGTNNYHGSLFLKIDRPGLNAFQRDFGFGSTPGAVQKDTDRFNQYGGSVGGPIIKNRLFAFFSYETLRNNSVSTSQTWAETPQFLSQAPAGSIANALLTFPGEGTSIGSIVAAKTTCANANIPAASCQEVNGGLDIGSPIKTLPLGTLDPTFGGAGTPFGVGGGLDGIPDIAFVETTNPTINTQTQYNGSIDFQVTHNDLVSFKAYWVPNNATFFNGNARAANLWHSDRLNQSAALIWNHTFSPTLINEARFNVSRWHFNELDTNPQEPFGLPQDPIQSIGNIGGFTIVFGANGPGIFYKTSYNFHDGATKVKGNQTFKFGFDFYDDQNTDVSAGGALPQYQFRNLWDFLNDAPIQENANFNPLTGDLTQTRHYIRNNSYAGYIQDDWKLRPNLTVNLGLRYEYFGPIHEKFGNLSVAEQGPASDPLGGASVRVGGNLYNSSKGDVGPQLGFAWSPTSLPLWNQDFQRKLVIRGGFGVGYSREEEAIALNGRSNPPLVASESLNPGQGILYAASSSPTDFNGYPANPATVIVFNPTTNLPASGAAVNLTGFDRNLANPVTYRYSLGIQYDLGHDWVLSVGYQGSLSRHYTRNQNLNLQFFDERNPQIQNYGVFTNDSNASYNALLTELQHKFSRTFEIDAQYAYSKAEDNYSGDFFGGTDPFDRQSEWGPSNFDATHNFKLYGLWTPRIFHGDNDWREKILGNWTISGILNAHTGFPWTALYNVQVLGTPSGNSCSLLYDTSGFCTVRAASYLGGALSDFSNHGFIATGQGGNFPNGATSYFTPPDLTSPFTQTPTPGVPRDFFRGPRYSSIDMTLGKAFGLPRLPILGENAKLDFRANFYNIFNQLNFTPLNDQTIGTIQLTPNGTGGFTQSVINSNATFGQGSSALGGRIIEAQVRFSF